MNESVASGRNGSSYAGPSWPTVIGTMIAGVCTVIGAVVGASITANSNWIGVNASTASTNQQQQLTIVEQRQLEDREKRSEAYLEYLSNLDVYFNAMFTAYGCTYWEVERTHWEVERGALSSSMLPGVCRTPMRALQPADIGTKFLAYWNARSKLFVYGSGRARSEMGLIELELPTLSQEDPTVWVISGGLNYDQYWVHYSELQRIARCDLLAEKDIKDQCRRI